jgi:signal transduction histidine kinase
LGGTLDLEGRSGHGTTLAIRIPLGQSPSPRP